jgi:hypothetical protein
MELKDHPRKPKEPPHQGFRCTNCAAYWEALDADRARRIAAKESCLACGGKPLVLERF